MRHLNDAHNYRSKLAVFESRARHGDRCAPLGNFRSVPLPTSAYRAQGRPTTSGGRKFCSKLKADKVQCHSFQELFVKYTEKTTTDKHGLVQSSGDSDPDMV